MVDLLLIALQTAPVTPVPAVVAPISACTPATFGVAATGLAGLITAIGIAASAILKEIRANADVGAKAGASRDQKLDRIEVLVDGRYGEVLQELARLTRVVADASGKPSDQLKATAAQTKADEHTTQIDAANAARTGT